MKQKYISPETTIVVCEMTVLSGVSILQGPTSGPYTQKYELPAGNSTGSEQVWGDSKEETLDIWDD